MFRHRLFADDDQFAVLHFLLDAVIFVAVQVLDGFDLMHQIAAIANGAPVQSLAQQFGLLSALKVIAVDDATDALRRQTISVVFHLNKDKAAVATITLVRFQNCMSRRA